VANIQIENIDSVPPIKVAEILNNLYHLYEAKAAQLGLEVLNKNANSHFTVAAGLENSPKDEPAERIATLSLMMLRSVASIRQEEKINVTLKMGMSSGAVTAGLTGTAIYSYDLWGDTCLVAAELANQANQDCILVSEETCWYLSNRNYQMEPKEVINFMDLVSVKSYRLQGRRSSIAQTIDENGQPRSHSLSGSGGPPRSPSPSVGSAWDYVPSTNA